jgi:Glycosyltransferase family 87
VAPVRPVRVPLSRLAAFGLVVVSVAATSAIVLAEPSLGPYAVLAVLVVAFGALALVLALGSLRRWLGVGAVLALSGGLLLGSALAPARPSDDLWLYSMYGRTIVEHHDNPYVHPPSDYPDDPLYEHVNPYWATTTARYGPVFIGITAAVAVVAGDHPLPTRIAYQFIAALAVFISLVLIARRVRSAAAVAIVGLNPVTAYIVVNGGHNDALVGLAILGGVLLETRHRHIPAALAFTAAALIKAPAGLALVAYLAWLAYQRGPRVFVRAASVAGGVAFLTLLVVGVENALGPLFGSREFILPHSPWTLFASGGIRKAFGYGYVELGSVEHLATVGTVTGIAVGAIFVASRLREMTVLHIALGALLAYLFVSVYTAPWYAGWVLPMIALSWRWRVSLYAFAFFAVLMIDDRFGDAVFPQVFLRRHTFQVLLANWINTLTMLAAIGGVAMLLWYRRSGSSPGEADDAIRPGERSETQPVTPA